VVRAVPVGMTYDNSFGPILGMSTMVQAQYDDGQQNQKSLTSGVIVVQFFQNIQPIIRYDNRTAQVSLNFE
jgi:hypothetical protein